MNRQPLYSEMGSSPLPPDNLGSSHTLIGRNKSTTLIILTRP